MRVIVAAAAALAVVAVSGCDINTGPAKTAKVECNCSGAGTPPAGLRPSTAYEPPAEPYHHRWHRGPHGYGYAGWHGGRGHSYYWRREYAEMSVVTYDYHSDSHSYYTSGGGSASSGASAYAYAASGSYGGGSAYAGGGAHGGDGYHTADHGWIDGHGHGHDGGATVGTPAHYETVGDDRGRLHPWHGYDADCPDAPGRH